MINAGGIATDSRCHMRFGFLIGTTTYVVSGSIMGVDCAKRIAAVCRGV